MSTGNILPQILLSSGLPSNSHYLNNLIKKSTDMSPGTSPDTETLPPELEENSLFFSKKEYINIIRKKRHDFVHNFFSDEIKELSIRLEEGARRSKPCHYEVKFDVPEHFNIEKTENILREYFGDYGYSSVVEPRSADSNIIILTIS